MQHSFPCHSCGSTNLLGQRFCITCGRKLYYACPHCNNSVSPQHKFCTKCGNVLNWEFQLHVPKTNESKQEHRVPLTIDGVLSYISNEDVRSLAIALVKDVASWHDPRILIRPIAHGISFKVAGSVFMRLWPARKSFTLSYYRNRGKLSDYKVTTIKSFTKAQKLAKDSFLYKVKNLGRK